MVHDKGAAERRSRLVAIVLMCGAMAFFTGIDTSAKFLGRSLPTVEVVWARYMIAALAMLVGSQTLRRPRLLIANKPKLQFIRSALLLGTTVLNFLALKQLQLAETSTIAFLLPLFVALLAGPLMGEKVGATRFGAIIAGFLGVAIAMRPGTAAFQPIVLVAILGVVCNAGYALATRQLAGQDAPQTTLAWTQSAGLVLLTPLIPFVWQTPQTLGAWIALAVMGSSAAAGHGLLILAHQRAPASMLAPFNYTQLIWMIGSGWLVFGDVPPLATLAGAAVVVVCGLFLIAYERR